MNMERDNPTIRIVLSVNIHGSTDVVIVIFVLMSHCVHVGRGD